MADPLAEQARDDHRGDEVDRDDPEGDRQRPVGRGKRHERSADPELGERVEDGGDDVDREEGDRQERQVAVELNGQEARPAR